MTRLAIIENQQRVPYFGISAWHNLEVTRGGSIGVSGAFGDRTQLIRLHASESTAYLAVTGPDPTITSTLDPDVTTDDNFVWSDNGFGVILRVNPGDKIAVRIFDTLPADHSKADDAYLVGVHELS